MVGQWVMEGTQPGITAFKPVQTLLLSSGGTWGYSLPL